MFSRIVAFRAETPGRLRRILGVAGDSGKIPDSLASQLAGQITDGVGKLGENEHFFAGMRFREKFRQLGELPVFARFPVAGKLQK